ncbi:putative type II secretion system protein [Campylobacter iguaniorum]|uniref:type II secretion system protein n=1 Tax=Campylobacter iguaniorum TaxID=1244531 RepID=UPI0007C95EFA|nr:type II secretion system protein [Campylobacter iguaniorum]ANE35422.1 putative type II secretion system protein [Campylobacter iguaniorum]
MKKGFTMIELVFVIVILGILASLAVPKLAATKDDAEAAKAAVEMKDAINQLATYYIVKGKFEKDGDVTTNSNNGTAGSEMSKTITEVLARNGNKWTDCVTITLSNSGTNGEGANIKVAKKDNSTSSFCQAVRGTQAFKDWVALTNGIQVGGSSIFKEDTKQ